jgi:hypothetical protein
MLEGAQFPPVVIFEDTDGWKYWADDHHRVDAAALAALKDPRRKAEVLAEIRPNGHDPEAFIWSSNVKGVTRRFVQNYAKGYATSSV